MSSLDQILKILLTVPWHEIHSYPYFAGVPKSWRQFEQRAHPQSVTYLLGYTTQSYSELTETHWASTGLFRSSFCLSLRSWELSRCWVEGRIQVTLPRRNGDRSRMLPPSLLALPVKSRVTHLEIIADYLLNRMDAQLQGLSSTTNSLKTLLLSTLKMKKTGTEEEQTESLLDLRAAVIELRSNYTGIL